MLLVGLTGNYGMGKSAVLEMFARLGAFTVDADRVVAGLLAEKAVLERLRLVLGDGAFDREGRIIKERVSEMIFSDPALRRRVEDVLHPLVFERVDEAVRVSGAQVAVVEAPVIFERGHEGRFHRTITVYTDEETAMRRLARSGVSREEARRRLACQMPAGQKAARSDFAIDNSGTPEETMARVREIYGALRAEAARTG
ncbi:MAG: dephospho-CoA kinase [Thermodesulfovibrionales bacterium]